MLGPLMMNPIGVKPTPTGDFKPKSKWRMLTVMSCWLTAQQWADRARVLECKETVKTWLREVNRVTPYFTVAHRDEDMQKLVQATATGSLLDEYERFMGQQPNRAGVTWPAIHLVLRNAFWGLDEEEALKAIVEMMQQGETDSVPDCNWRFETVAESA